MDKQFNIIKIQLLPYELKRFISQCVNPLPQKCYQNCGTITMLNQGDNPFSIYCRTEGINLIYCLGLLTDCYGETHPHAWLKIEQNGSGIYCDPTLEINSQTWMSRRREFKYVLYHELSRFDILKFFKLFYSEREFNEYGIPLGPGQFPIININGKVICEKELEP